MTSVKHFQLILGALEIGLPDDGPHEISCDLPHVFDNLHPPTSVRAVVVIDGDPYEVYVKAAEPGEAHEPGVNDG